MNRNPDLADIVTRLLETGLGAFEVFNFQGQQVTGDAFIAALQSAAGRTLKVGRLPWFVLSAMAPFNVALRAALAGMGSLRGEVAS